MILEQARVYGICGEEAFERLQVEAGEIGGRKRKRYPRGGRRKVVVCPCWQEVQHEVLGRGRHTSTGASKRDRPRRKQRCSDRRSRTSRTRPCVGGSCVSDPMCRKRGLLQKEAGDERMRPLSPPGALLLSSTLSARASGCLYCDLSFTFATGERSFSLRMARQRHRVMRADRNVAQNVLSVHVFFL